MESPTREEGQREVRVFTSLALSLLCHRSTVGAFFCQGHLVLSYYCGSLGLEMVPSLAFQALKQ